MGCILLSASLSPPHITRFNPACESIKVPERRAAVRGKGGQRGRGVLVELLLGLPSNQVLPPH